MLNVGPGRRDLIVALVGRTVSTFGDGVALVALTLRLQADGAHPWEVALLLGGGVVPQLLLARPIGRLADTHDSRRLLVAGGLAEVATTIPLIFLHSVVAILPLVAVLGAATSLTAATWSALIPRVVGEDHLAEAISAQQSLSVLALVGAPAVGGLLAGAFGTGVPVALDVATYVVVTVAAVLVRTRRVPERVAGGRRAEPAPKRIRHPAGRLGARPAARRRRPRRPPRRDGRRRAGVPRPRDTPRRRRLVRRDRGVLDGGHGGGIARGGPRRDRAWAHPRHDRRRSRRLRRGGRLRRRAGRRDPRSPLGARRRRERLRRSLPVDPARCRARPTAPAAGSPPPPMRSSAAPRAPRSCSAASSRSCCRLARSTPLPACSASPLPEPSRSPAPGGVEREPEVGLEPTAYRLQGVCSTS